MVFHRDEPLRDMNADCPICGGKTKRSVFLPALHDGLAAVNYIVITTAMGFLAYIAAYQLTVYYKIDVQLPYMIGWFSTKQLVVFAFLIIGGIAAHFLLKLHFALAYFAKGLSLQGTCRCQKCGNQFIIAIPIADAEDMSMTDAPHDTPD